MNGLNEIIAINNHAAAKAREETRRSAGLKPACAVGKVLRATRPTVSQSRAGSRSVTVQGRTISV